MTTDTSEKGLGRLICTALTGADCDPPQDGMVRERPSAYGFGRMCGDPRDYDREYCVLLQNHRHREEPRQVLLRCTVVCHVFTEAQRQN